VALAARQVDELLGERVAQVVADGRRGEAEEVAGADLVLLVGDLGDAAAGQDVDELFFTVVGVVDERLLAGRDAQQVDADAGQPARVAERVAADLGGGVQGV
jgi:hypothetical protein